MKLYSLIASILTFAFGLFGWTKAQLAVLFHRISRKGYRPRRFIQQIPFAVRMFFLMTALTLQPICGGSGINGARVVLYCNLSESAGDQWTIVGGQMGVNFADKTAEIDVSDKLSGRLGERVPGRATASVSLELNFLTDDPAQDFIKAAYRDREEVMIQRFYRDTADVLTGEAIEEATGIIVNLSESHPDQGKSTVTLEVSLNNDWVPSA